MIKNIFLLVIFLLLSFGSVFADSYYMSSQKSKAEALYQDGIFLRLRLKESPHTTKAVFLYDIERVRNPDKLDNRTLDNSLFAFEKGNFYLSKGDYSQAVARYREALDINPSFISAHYNMAVAYFLWGKYKKSIANFKIVAGLQPSSGYPYFYLGWIYKQLENYRESEEYLKKAKKIFTAQSNAFLVKETERILTELKLFPGK